MTPQRPAARLLLNVLSAGATAAMTAAGTTIAAMTSVAAPAWPAESSVAQIVIGPQSLATALQSFSQQSGLQVGFESELAKGLKTQGTRGAKTPAEALDALLSGTGLEFRFVNDQTVVIREKGARQSAIVPAEPVLRLAASQSQTTQETRAASDGAADANDAKDDAASKVNEVIVTATKRAERIQDVPVSIAVVTAEDIDKRGLVSSDDYLRGIPGVNQVSDSYNQGIYIRGIAVSPMFQNFDGGTTTATYFGETPTTNSAGIANNSAVDIKLIDIERVEVLRGPQGTAFGNSSLGGAVRTIPVAPQLDRFEGKVGVNYSLTSREGGDNHMAQGIVNIPLVEGKLGIRANAYRFDDSGFYRNASRSDAATLAAATNFGGQAFAADADEIGATSFVGGRIAALWQPTDKLEFTVNYLKQKTEMDGIPVAMRDGYVDVSLQVPPEQVQRGQRYGLSDTDIDIASAVLEYDLAWANLTAVYSALDSGSVYIASASRSPAFSPSWPRSNKADSTHSERVGEIRLATQFSGALNGIVGVYMEEVDDDALVNELYWHGDPARNPRFPGVRFEGNIFQYRDLEQKAAFAEVSWKLLPRFTLTGGVRAYDYERTSRDIRNGVVFGGSSVTDRVSDANGTSFRGNLSFKPTEGSLLYAGWAEGFRLGIPQTGLPPGLCDTNNDGIVDGTSVTITSTRQTKSDTVESMELGGKASLFDRRVNIDAAVFRIEWDGMPIRQGAPIQPLGCGLAYTANAGSARSEGVEFQVTTQVTEAIRLDTGASWIDAKLTQDAPALRATAGTKLPASPEFNANFGAEYGFKVLGYGAFVRADAIYVGEFYGNLTRLPDTRSGDYVKVDLSARLALNRLTLDVYARNLTNADDFVFRAVTDGQGPFYGWRLRPRTVGVQLGYQF